MHYRLHLKPYQWSLQPPLLTHHGTWAIREGILIGLQRAGHSIGWGDIAPIPWFGTEAIAEALAFCRECPNTLTRAEIFAIPASLPACQFGFGSAWDALHQEPAAVEIDYPPAQVCALLRAGEAALADWHVLWQQGHRTFKWKIGVFPLGQELDLLQQLVAALPPPTRLRLDANGGLTLAEAQQWLKTCDRLSSSPIEYLEQPLPPPQWMDLVHLSQTYQTQIALDESVTTLAQLQQCFAQGWRELVVIKPALAGYPQSLRAFLGVHPLETVFSSAFETKVGRRMVLQLAQEFHPWPRALGLGTQAPDESMLRLHSSC